MTLLLPLVWGQQDYCSITPQHTMCQYKGFGSKCGGTPLARGVTEREKQEIVDIHNRFRAKLARGEEKRGAPGPQPPASDMQIMEWDDELAIVAQRHADQCNFNHDCNDCRRVSRFGVGQNLYIYKQTQSLGKFRWTQAVTDWYDEVELFSRKKIDPFQFASPYGHYSQLVWANTNKIGCGGTSYREGRWFATLYTCNYGPGGNFISLPMYQQGAACSKCPTGQVCSNTFPGLCEPSFRRPTIPVNPIVTIAPVSRPRPTTRRPRPIATTRKPTKPTTRRTTTARTTTLRPVPQLNNTIRPIESSNKTLFYCNFETGSTNCNIRSSGVKWRLDANEVNSVTNHFYTTKLSDTDRTEMFFEKLIQPPANQIICLDFKFKKFSTGDSVPLSVLAWPFKGKPGRVTIQRDSPDLSTWIRAQITFRNVDHHFLIMLASSGPGGVLGYNYLAIDDVVVNEGVC